MTKAARIPLSLGIGHSFDIRHPPSGGFFLLLAGVSCVLNEGGDAAQFFFETRNETRRPVLKQDDEAEGEKYKQENPEQSSNEGHARTLTYSLSAVNGLVRNIRQSLPLMLR